VDIDLNDLEIKQEDRFTEAEKLLAEWYNWWYSDDNVPAKPKNALHMRTIVYFVTLKHELNEV